MAVGQMQFPSRNPTRGELAIMMVALDSRLAAHETFRVHAEENALRFMTLDIYEARHAELVKSVDEVREKLATFMAAQAGRESGVQHSTTLFFAIPAVIATVVSIVTTLITILT